MSTLTVPTPSQQAHAAALLAECERWSRGRSKVTGREFWVIPSSDGERAHWTALDGSGCTCRGHFHRGLCSHVLAAKARQERERPAQPAPATDRYSAIFPAED